MNSKLIELHATLTSGRDEKGQRSLEYLGILVVAGVLIAAVVDALGNGGELTTAIRNEIKDIVGRGDGA